MSDSIIINGENVMKFDWADVGNLVLGIGAGISGYLVAKGYVAESVLVIAVVGAIKAFCSAIDNYNFKKANSTPQ